MRHFKIKTPSCLIEPYHSSLFITANISKPNFYFHSVERRSLSVMSPHSLSPTVTAQSLVSTEGKFISSGCPVSASIPCIRPTTVQPHSPRELLLIAGVQYICWEYFHYVCTTDKACSIKTSSQVSSSQWHIASYHFSRTTTCCITALFQSYVRHNPKCSNTERLRLHICNLILASNMVLFIHDKIQIS